MVLENFFVGLILVSFSFFYFFLLRRSFLFLDEVTSDLGSPFFYCIKIQDFMIFAGLDLFLIDDQIIFQNIQFVVAKRLLFFLEGKPFSYFQTTIIFELLNGFFKSYLLFLFVLR